MFNGAYICGEKAAKTIFVLQESLFFFKKKKRYKALYKKNPKPNPLIFSILFVSRKKYLQNG